MIKIISKTFTFEAAHYLLGSSDKKNRRIHGHSFLAEVSFEGRILSNGMITDFKKIDTNLTNIIKTLDHSFLNDIPGLDNPTLENIGSWIWKQLEKKHKNIYEVKVSRKSCGEKFILQNN